MIKQIKYYIILFALLFTIIPHTGTNAASDSWHIEGAAVYADDGSVQITSDSSRVVGSYLKNTSIDTRNGFAISFDYYYGKLFENPYEGFQLIFENRPIYTPDSVVFQNGWYKQGYYSDGVELVPKDTLFYGIEFRRQSTVSSVYYTDDTLTTLTSNELKTQSEQWYKVTVNYDDGTLNVYQDNALVLSCTSFCPPAISYVGFVGSTSHWGCMQQFIRNVEITANDACYVNFDADGGKINIKSKIISCNNKYGELPTPKKYKAVFKGWYLNGNKITENSNINIAESHTLKAMWKNKSFKAKLDAGKGSVSKKKIKLKYNESVGSLPTPKRKGYRFKGWFTKKSGGQKIVPDTISNTISKKGKKVYAQWQKNTDTNSSNSNNSSPSNSSSSDRKHKVHAQECSFCQGDGDCTNCNGRGYKYSFAMDNRKLTCYKCRTTGKCRYCNGTGKR